MKTQNTLKALRRYLLGTVAVMAVGGFSYLVFNGDQNRVEGRASSAGLQPTPAGEGAPPGAGVKATPPGQPVRTHSSARAQSPGLPAAMFKSTGAAIGSPMLASGSNPDADKGRVLKLDPVAIRNWDRIKEGEPVQLPTPGGEPLEGLVNLVQRDGGWLRIGGSIPGGRGSFSLNTNFSEVSGMILLPESGIGYKIQMDGNAVVLVERRLSTLVCFPSLNGGAVAASSDGLARKPVAVAATVPLVNTRPGARGVIFVDFDGETVTDPVWNGGQTINAAPSLLAPDEISRALALVAQDYAPFDVTLTTDSSLYATTAPGLRMHVVVTPTDSAAPGSGGVAYVDSWSGAGRGFRSDVVCWVFNQSFKAVAEAISHEVGHTLGLGHDGQTNGNEYYAGHGGSLTTATSWAPIMGVGYYKNLVQWSRGEYALANNTEDDLAIIGKVANKFGLILGDLPNGSKSLALAGSSFQNEGLLRSADSVDVYKFSTSGGLFTAGAQPAGSETDLDVKLELVDAAGTTVQLSDLPEALSANINKTLSAGSYQLFVRPSGAGLKPASGYTTGYSPYGSVGRYLLTGSLQGGVSLPVFTSPTAISGSVGTPLSFKIGVSAGATVSVKASALPAGLNFNLQTLALSGMPTEPTGSGAPGAADGPGLLSLIAANSSGAVSADFIITIAKGGIPLADAFPKGQVSTTPAAPWTGVNLQRADGTVAGVAQSGLISNNGSTTLAFDYTAPSSGGQALSSSLLTFYWKASTEPLGNRNRTGDFVQCRVNGRLAADTDTGNVLLLSGETGWVKQTVRLRGTGTQRVEFIYTKDASLAAGLDRVWVYATTVGERPSILKQPVSVKIQNGVTSFTLSAEVQGADSLVWKKDFATLGDGISPGGSIVSGAKTAALNVGNVSGGDMGYYWLEARNAFGAVVTNPVQVVIAAPPVFTQQPAAPVGLKVGDPLTLSGVVSGATPLRYQWVKDGVGTAWRFSESGVISLSFAKTSAASAGKYKVLVVNQFGSTASVEVDVSFAQGSLKPSR